MGCFLGHISESKESLEFIDQSTNERVFLLHPLNLSCKIEDDTVPNHVFFNCSGSCLTSYHPTCNDVSLKEDTQVSYKVLE